MKDLFSLPPTMTSVERIYYDEQRSTSQLSGNEPIAFNIAAQNSLEYIDLKRSRLYLKARTKHATEYIGPINNFLHSMFSQVDFTIQNKLITSTTTHYPYKAMIQKILSYGTDAKKSHLTSQLYFKDKLDIMMIMTKRMESTLHCTPVRSISVSHRRVIWRDHSYTTYLIWIGTY